MVRKALEPLYGSPPESGSDLRYRDLVADACRVLAAAGLVEAVLGHVSLRVGPDRFLVRGRGPGERGLRYTAAADIQLMALAETGEARVLSQAGGGPWAPPNELPIHTGVLRSRPDVTAVVHAHPPATVAVSIAALPWRPIFGAYDIPAARLAAEGIPVWPRACLVNTPELARDMCTALGKRPVVVLAGHGLVSVAGGEPTHAVARAVIQAVWVESLARMSLAVHAAGGALEPISDEDLRRLPDLGAGLNVDALWRYHRSRAGLPMT